MLRLSFVCDACIVAKLTARPRTKVTIDGLQEVAYNESIGTKMNNLHLCLEVV